ncbi:FG-GAP repeat domain-containing protein, partial [Streptomyces roseolilacinus]|uniref:FG-GAP repeat domain-containing protein n=1 Tax=Streptomyces roseolilacinus TaxID=66904 RepID=UPI00382BAC41
YQGRGDGTFAARVRIGGGWNAYTHLVGTGDLNRDGRADVYGFGPDARSYAYFATGDATAPFRAGVPLTALHEGWQTYDHVG